MQTLTSTFLACLIVVSQVGRFITCQTCTGELDTSRAIPVLDARSCDGHYAVGYATGRAFAEQTALRIASSPSLQRLLVFLNTTAGREVLRGLTDVHQQQYPDYWDELTGIADGSGIPLEQVIMLNMRYEINAAASPPGPSVADCSDVLLHFPDQDTIAVAHNEDETRDSLDRCFMLHAQLDGGEAWTAYTYPGELASSAFGFNQAGVAFTLNAVFPQHTLVPAIGRNFISRDLLAATSIDDALHRISAPWQGVGHSYNLMDLDTGRILNAEVGPRGVMDVREITNGSYFHVNQFQHLAVPQQRDASSEHRLRREAQYPAVTSIPAALHLLGDTQDQKYPIYRSGDDDVYTLCTAVFNLKAQVLQIYQGNPRLGNITFQLPLNFPSPDERGSCNKHTGGSSAEAYASVTYWRVLSVASVSIFYVGMALVMLAAWLRLHVPDMRTHPAGHQMETEQVTSDDAFRAPHSLAAHMCRHPVYSYLQANAADLYE